MTPMPATRTSPQVLKDGLCRTKKDARGEQEGTMQKVQDHGDELPRITGWLWQRFPGFFYGESDKARWVVLDRIAGTLSLWQKPLEADCKGTLSEKSWAMQTRTKSAELKPSWFRPSAPSKPLQVLSLQKLSKVGTNAKWKNIFLRFRGDGDGDFYCFTAENQDEFVSWVDALRKYNPQT